MKWRGKRLTRWHLLLAALLLAPLIAYVIDHSPYANICGYKYANAENCTSEGPIWSSLSALANFVEDWHGIIEALSTLAIAFFTYTLWRSTTKLSDAAIQQGKDTQESLRISGISANASKKSAEVAEATLLRSRPWIARENIQIVEPITMTVADESYRSIGVNLKITLTNKGDSAALDAVIFGFISVDERSVTDPQSVFMEVVRGFARFGESGGQTIHRGDSTPEINVRISGKVPNDFSLDRHHLPIYMFIGVAYRFSFGNHPAQYELTKFWLSDVRSDEQMAEYPDRIDPKFIGPMFSGNYSGRC